MSALGKTEELFSRLPSDSYLSADQTKAPEAPDQAVEKSREMVALAQALGHPFSLAQALVWTTWFHQYRRDDTGAREHAEAVIRVSTEQGFSIWLAIANIFDGWALVMQGERTEGMAQLQRGIADFLAAGAEADLPHYLALRAEAYCPTGQRDDALSALAEALAQVDKTENRNYEAELYRLKGILTLQTEVPDGEPHVTEICQPRSSTQAEVEAEECFHRAIEIARRQGAKSLELRAVTSLARLWRQQGKKEEARNMLAETYGWFTEGFGTPDLKDAQALLEELGG